MAEERELSKSLKNESMDKCREIESPQSGDRCPRCWGATLEYNGLLNLECTNCHFEIQGGAFT